MCPKTATLVEAMQRMTDRQQDFFIRILERLPSDKAFVIRLSRESPIVHALLWAENYPALERWFARKTLEVVKKDG